MRNFKILAVLSAALVMGAGASAKESPDQPKPRKVCRTEHMPGRVTPKRVCRVVVPSGPAAQDDRRKTTEPRERGN